MMAVMTISRRSFLQRGALVMAGAAMADVWAAGERPPALRFGLVTDVHFANKPSAGTRAYRQSLSKIREAVSKFNEMKADFAIELGDLIDAAPTVEQELDWLKVINAEFAKVTGDRHYVLGNHCVWTLTKPQFLAGVGLKAAHYSFDKGGFHFVVLDANYRADGVTYSMKNFVWHDCEIPAAEREWLADDLKATGKPTVVFVHQRVDGPGQHAIKSHAAVRKILEDSGKVLAVFQGHQHINDHKEINGIHYCTMMATVEGEQQNAYAVVDLHADRTIVVDGFHKQVDYHLA